MVIEPVRAQTCAERQYPFVGRASELGLVQAWFDNPDAFSKVLVIDGPIGIGKSTLLSEIARQARQHGAHVARLAGLPFLTSMTVPGWANQLASRRFRRSVIMIDDYDHLMAMWPAEKLLAELPRQGVLIALTSRSRLSEHWSADPFWRDGMRRVSLNPLTITEAREYLVRMGVDLDKHSVDAIVRRARGLPLALAAATLALEVRPATSAIEARNQWIAELRSALTILDFPTRLQETPLAARLGRSGRELRTLLQDGLMAYPPRSPMSTEDQRILREAFCEQAERPEEAAARLYLSRATYYRKLRSALERLGAALATIDAAPIQPGNSQRRINQAESRA